jgi:large subunit ribosomal protein L21
MYAVISSGGTQTRVEKGQRVRVDLRSDSEGADISFTPSLVVDGDQVFATPDQLSGYTVSARVVGTEKGPKIRGFNYKNKSRVRRRWGHRQHYTTVEITGISGGSK